MDWKNVIPPIEVALIIAQDHLELEKMARADDFAILRKRIAEAIKEGVENYSFLKVLLEEWVYPLHEEADRLDSKCPHGYRMGYCPKSRLLLGTAAAIKAAALYLFPRSFGPVNKYTLCPMHPLEPEDVLREAMKGRELLVHSYSNPE